MAAQDVTVIADQKGRILRGLFASPKLSRARATSPDAVAQLEAEARAQLEAGLAELDQGRPSVAIEHFDAGLRAISSAAALAAPEVQPSDKVAAEEFKRIRGRVDSYLSALQATEELSAEHDAELIDLSGRLDEADQSFAVGEILAARGAVEDVYTAIVALVSDVQRGHTLMVERRFASPQEEYAYEQERHRSYGLLVEIAMTENADDQPGLAGVAAQVMAESERLRKQAEAERRSGDIVTAIATMERATARLGAVLRAAGLPVME